MGWIEDSVEEFKKLPPAGKLAVGGAAVGVVILAIAQARSSASSGATSSPTDTTGTTPTASTPGTPDWSTWFSNGLTPPPSNSPNSLSFGDLGGTNPGTPTIPQISWGNTGGSVSVPSHVAGPVRHKKLGHHVTEHSAPTPKLGHHVTEHGAPAPQLGHHVTEHASSAYNSTQQTRLAGALASR